MNVLILKLWIVFLSLFIPEVAYNQQDLKNAIREMENDPELKHSSWSVFVKDYKTGTVIAEKNGNLSLIPASVMKTISTFTALEQLGPQFKFETTLAYSGIIDSTGNLNGNLYIIGSGDPTIGSDRFGVSTDWNLIQANWIKKLKLLGIQNINGNLIVDHSIFSDQMIPDSWVWGDIGNYYGCGPSGLSIYENKYTVFFQPGKSLEEAAPVIRIVPENVKLNYTNKVTTGKYGSGDQVMIYGAPHSTDRIFEGTVPAGRNEFGVKGSIPDPPLLLAESFAKELEKHNIHITENIKTSHNTDEKWLAKNVKYQVVAKHYSPDIETIINKTNTFSINVFAESLFKYTGSLNNESGSYVNGQKAVVNFLQKKGLSLSGVEIIDGSGLSRKNKVTTRFMVDFLETVKNSNHYKSFYESLPIAGRTGSLSRMLKNTTAENNLRAKSGYMSGVRSYAGYVTSKSGKEIIFALIINNYDTSARKIRSKLEKIMHLISEI